MFKQKNSVEHLIRICLEYYEKYILVIFHHFSRYGIFHNLNINALRKNYIFTFCTNHIEI